MKSVWLLKSGLKLPSLLVLKVWFLYILGSGAAVWNSYATDMFTEILYFLSEHFLVILFAPYYNETLGGPTLSWVCFHSLSSKGLGELCTDLYTSGLRIFLYYWFGFSALHILYSVSGTPLSPIRTYQIDSLFISIIFSISLVSLLSGTFPQIHAPILLNFHLLLSRRFPSS